MSPEKTTLDQLRIDRSAGDRQRARGRRWLLPVAAVLVALFVLVGWWTTRSTVVEVVTAAARERTQGRAGTVLNASGYVTARRQATVSSKVTGKVVEVLIEEGMEVEEGQVLARLDQTNVRAGYELAAAQLAAAKSSLRETEVRLAEAELELGRQRRLVSGEIGSQDALDRAQAEADAVAARLERERREVEVAERQLAVWRRELEDRVIRAPFSGVVVAKNAQPGEMISPISAGGGFTRTGIGTLVDMASLEIEVDVNEAYINRVAAGQEVTATLDAYPDWQIPCRVIAIIPTADRQKATVQVRVGFDELDPRILPDMGVKVGFREAGDEAAGRAVVVVPRDAVRQSEGEDAVFVVADGRAELRAVAVGAGFGDEVEIASGVATGERVVVDGFDGLADGAPVRETTR